MEEKKNQRSVAFYSSILKHKPSSPAPVRGKKTQEGNVSLHLPWNIADKTDNRPATRSRGDLS